MSEETKTPEEFGREVYTKALKELRDSVPKIGINLLIAVAIWLIGNYVFIPISQGLFIQTYAVTQIVSLIILIVIAILVIGILRELRDVADAGAGLTAYHIGQIGQVTPEEYGSYRTAFRGFLFVIVVAALFLLFAQQLNVIHPALAAIALLIIVIWAVITLYRSGRALSKVVGRYASEWAERFEKRLKGA